jgi:hypothetical protein
MIARRVYWEVTAAWATGCPAACFVVFAGLGRCLGLGHVLSIVWWVVVVVHYVAMAGRGELTDEAWVAIEPLLPPAGGVRGRWRDHRQVINGILWKLHTGPP